MVWFWERSGAARHRHRGRARRRPRPSVEGLESRALLAAVAGVDYNPSGSRWANPAHITFSIAPDSVQWEHGLNNLNATFDAELGSGTWERAIAKALATWESVANINIAQVADSPLFFDIMGLPQGDPRFGDIRFGGYPFLNDTTTLARTSFPPPNGTTEAGDVEINTALDFHLGSDYDLYSEMLHETGHSLGLDHPTNPAEVMAPRYQGLRDGLAPGDIAGIQSLYGPRNEDLFQQQGQGVDPSSAIDLTAALDAAHRVTLDRTSLATVGDTEYFSVVAPSFPGASLQVTASAGGISLLSPKISVFDANGRALDVEGDPNAWGNSITAQVDRVVPGQRYTLAVTGATNDVFAVGAYRLDVAFNGDTSLSSRPAPTPIPSPIPTSTPAPAATAVPAPITSPGSNAAPSTTVTGGSTPGASLVHDTGQPNETTGQVTALGTITTVNVGGLSLGGASDVDRFSFKTARAGTYQVSASGTSVVVLDGSGNVVASGSGRVGLRSPRARSGFTVEIRALNGATVPSYSMTISPRVGRLMLGPGRHAPAFRRSGAIGSRWHAIPGG